MRKLLSIMLSVMMIFTVVPRVDVHAENTENFTNVVVFAYFNEGNTNDYYNSNETGIRQTYRSLRDDAFFQNETVRNDLKSMYDGDSVTSLKNYLLAISDQKFKVNNVFPQDNGTIIKPYCITSVTLQQALTGNYDDQIIEEIMNNVDLPSGIKFDYKNTGLIDNLTVILRGGKGAVPGKTIPTMYCHKADFSDTSKKWKNTNMSVSTFNMLNTYSLMEYLGSSEAGVISHEFLHSIGFPDLYPIEDGVYPVGKWDIMASSTRYESYPLAYMRMKIGNWIPESDIPVINQTTKSLTLDLQSNASGKRAYIIKSPLNSSEFFVVEFRKCPRDEQNSYQKPALDYYIGGSGIIVYRINPQVEALSNHRGDTAVYVFRPNGNSSSLDCDKAFLSEESGRTSMGYKDISKTLEDGAITFSDGTNSGIVISNVSSAKGNTMTFDVNIPSKNEYDTWENTNFQDTESMYDSKNVALKEFNGIPYMAVNRNGKLSLQKYENNNWTSVSNDIATNGVQNINLEVVSNELYMVYDDFGNNNVNVVHYNSSTKKLENVTKTNGTYSSVLTVNDELYITYDVSEGFNGNSYLGKLSNNGIQTLGNYYYGAVGQTKMAYSNGKIYVAVRVASGKVYIYEYANGKFNGISDGNYLVNTYDMVGNDNKLFLATAPNTQESKALNFYQYDGTQWTEIKTEHTSYEPKLVLSNNKIYLCSTPSDNGNLQVLRFDEDKNKFVEEGINIDSSVSSTSFMALNNDLYVAYVRGNNPQIVVKTKRQFTSYEATSYSKSLLLEGYIGLNFHMKFDPSVYNDNAYMKFSIEDDDKEQIVYMKDCKKVEGNYRFTCRLNSTQMDKYVTGQLFDASGNALSKASVSSVKKYVDAANKIDNFTAKDLVNATYNYGTYAKAFFNDEDVASTDAMNAITKETLAPYRSQKKGTLPKGLSLTSSALVLDSTLAIRHFFTVDQGYNINDYTFTVEGKTLEPRLVEGNKYYIEIENVYSTDLDKMYTLKVNDSYEYSYGAFTYAYLVLKQNSDQKLVKVMQSLYLYNQEADKYFK